MKPHKLQGDAHLKRGEFDHAVDCYRRAISIDSQFVDAYVGLGFALSELQRYAEAESALSHALSIDPAVADAHYILATIAKSNNDQSKSVKHFGEALQIKPDFEFAYRDFFDLLLKSEQLEDAKLLIKKAISVFPESAEFEFLLGNLLFNQQDYEGAIFCHTRAVTLEPTAALSHKILGDAYRNLRQHQKSVESYERAISLDPDNADAHVNLGELRGILGEKEKSTACYRRAIQVNPEHDRAHHLLGNMLLAKGDRQGAIACYRQAVELRPDNRITHLIAALSGERSDRAPPEYIQQLFDEYADRFDTHLVQVLHYNVPEKLAEMVSEISPPTHALWSILDLGCGTGLSGLPFARYAKELIGVDLSSSMLAKARARGIYSRLENLDLLSMMQSEPPDKYDVVVATDVLVYLGKLDELFGQIGRVLQSGGLFGFSIESLDSLMVGLPMPEDYHLTPTGRYAHSVAYLNRMALLNRFEILSNKKMQIRVDQGKSVQGYLMLWRRQ